MARVGRGRSRGGRVLDVSGLNLSERGGMGHGRIMAGRGTSAFECVNDSTKLSVDKSDYQSQYQTDGQKESLEKQLSQFVESGNGCFIKITLDYFSSNNHDQYYVDKIMDSLLKSSVLVEKFAMSFRLITLFKSYGQNIKNNMFKKLQTTYQDMLILMKEDCNSLSDSERCSVRNFCELMGQLFFRFRVDMDSLSRYNVLAIPTIECMKHLLKVNLLSELQSFLKLITMNYSALMELHKDPMESMALDIRQILVKGESNISEQERAILMCTVDLMTYGRNNLPPFLEKLYSELLVHQWTEFVPTSPTRMLVDIPTDIIDRHLDQFDVVVEVYNKHRFVDL